VLAEETGGDAIVNSNNFTDGYQRIVRDTNKYYLLGYTPTIEHRDGEFHRLTVRVKRPGVTVRARPGYYAPKPEEPTVDDAPALTGEPTAEGLSKEALDALRLPLAVSGLAVDVFTAPFRGTAAKSGSVLLGAQIDGTDLALVPGEILEVGYRAMDPEGKTTPGAFTRFELNLQPASRTSVAANGLRFAEWYTLPTGRHQVRFVVNQPNGRTGMVVADVEVPDFAASPVSLSGILLASERTASHHTLKGDEMLQKVLGAVPTAVRRFSRGDTVTGYVEAYTSGDSTLTGFSGSVTRVGTTRAQPVETRTVLTERGRAAVMTRLRLNALQPGDYVLGYEARAGRRTAIRQVLFTVTAE